MAMSDKLQTFASGATRTASRLRYDLIPPSALRALAERYGIGAVIHGEVNWQKGIPFSANIYHMQEHLERFKEGRVDQRTITPKDGSSSFVYTDADIENLAAVMWGAAAMIHFIETGRADLDDRHYAAPAVEPSPVCACHNTLGQPCGCFCPVHPDLRPND